MSVGMGVHPSLLHFHAIHGDSAFEPLGILSVSVYDVSNFVTINNSEQHPYMYVCVAEREL